MSSQPGQPPVPLPRPSFDKLLAILMECAVDAAAKAFVIMILGGIALQLVGGVTRQMVPSAPPGFAELQPPAVHPQWQTAWTALHANRFLLIFSVLLVLGLRWRLAKEAGGTSAGSGRWKRISHRLTENWFGLMVGNAFAAMGLSMALIWVQRFAFSQWVLDWFLAAFGSQLQSLGDHALGSAWVDQIKAWFFWYGDNQLKFNFWFLYLAGICDDLGVPNFKSLARWSWRRLRRRRTPSPNVSSASVGS